MVICIISTSNHIQEFKSQPLPPLLPPVTLTAASASPCKYGGSKPRYTTQKLLNRIITPLFSDGALLAGAYGGMTRNRLADALKEGLQAEQTDSSSLYDTLVNKLFIIQPGRQRQAPGGKESHSKRKRRNSQTREEAETSSPSTISCYTAHNQNTLHNVTIAIGIKYCLECTCSDLPCVTTVKKISVLNLGGKGPHPILSHTRLLLYSTETIQDNTSKLEEL